jgi:hypothetical protein
VFACAFAALWVRSLIFVEFVQIYRFGLFIWIDSLYGSLRIQIQSGLGNPDSISWFKSPIATPPEPFIKPSNVFERLGFYAAYPGNTGGLTLLAPYWSIVIPLVLLSAWLLLSRPKQPNPITELAT